MREGSSSLRAIGIAILCLLILGSAGLGQKSQAPNAISVLAKCEQCHGKTLQMSNLSLVDRAAMLKGGDHGPAIVPGNAAGSLLYQRITGEVQPAMPMAPVPKLTAEEIATVKDWIDAGAPMADERKPTSAAAKAGDASLLVYGSYEERKITDRDREWWSFQKPVRAAVTFLVSIK